LTGHGLGQQKIVFVASLLSMQHFKVRAKKTGWLSSQNNVSGVE